MYVQVPFFWHLGEISTPRMNSFTAGPGQSKSPVSCLIWHVLLRPPSSHPSSSVITLSLGLCFMSAAWKPHLDIWEYRRRGKPNGKISKNVAHSNPISFCICNWSSLDLDNCPFSSHFQHLISLFCWPTVKELESFSLGHSWSIEMAKMSLLLKAKYRYDSRWRSNWSLYMSAISPISCFIPTWISIISQPVHFDHKELFTTWDHFILNFNHAAFTPLASRFSHRNSERNYPRHWMRWVTESLLWRRGFAGYTAQPKRCRWRCKDWLHKL